MALPTIVAEAAWTTDPLATPSWMTIAKCRSLKTTGNHRSEALGRFEAGVIDATFTNKDRSLEPLFAGGANYPNIRTRKRVRFRAVANGGAGATYPIAHGYIEKVAPTYPKQWKDAVCTLTASDAFRLFAGLGLKSPYVLAVLADAPTAYYRLAEPSGGPTAFDSSGNGNHGSYKNSVALGAPPLVTDSADNAVTITGDNGYVALPPALARSGTADWSIEGLLSTTIGTNTQFLFQQGVSGSSITLAIGGGATGKAFAFVTGAASITSAATYNDGLPHHYVLTHSAAGALTLYLDGVSVGTSTGGTGPIDATVQPPTIGFGIPVPGLNDLYVVDEVAFYSTVLSAARVAAHNAARTAWLGDTSDGRITRLLDYIGWLAADRDLDAGIAVLTDAGDLASQKALDHLRLVDATEGGCLVMSRDGKVMFRNRRSIQNGPARNSVSQATFGDQGGAEIGWTDLGLAFDDVELANRITITRRGGIVALALDQAQITAAGMAQDRAQVSISSSDAEATSQANWLLALLKNPNRWRFEKVVVPLTNTNQDAVLGREIWDRITVAFTPPGGGARISQDVLIVGIDHNAPPGGGHWDVTFHTTGTDLQLIPFILGTSLLNSSDVLGY